MENEKKIEAIADDDKKVNGQLEQISKVAVTVPNLFGGEQMVKLPKKSFNKLMSICRSAMRLKGMVSRYDAELTKARETIRSLTDTIDSLKATIKNFEAFIEDRGLVDLFEKFLHPEKESVLAKLSYFKSHAREQDTQPKKTVNKKHDMER